MTNVCTRCGAPLERPDAPCARCVLDQALRAATPAPESAPAESSRAARGPRLPAPTPAELAPLFPELEIESLLGEGGMGAVYRAKQKKLGRTVALKLLHADLSADPAFVARFLREASALARLAHPGIVTVYEYGEQGARCWLLMELVEGTNLRALLREKKLAPRQALAIVRQLCDALQYAHDEGVVHRDIKPENVLVDRRGSVKIADFGLAKLVGAPEAQLTQVDQVMGTPHYMAPEQLEHPRDVDHRADIYSLGVVFYEMLTGELPLGRFAPPSRRVEVDVRLDEIVLRSLEHERERRYQHAVQVKTDVQRVESSPAAAKATVAEGQKQDGKKQHVLVWGLKAGHDGLKVMPGNHTPTAWGWYWILFAAWLVAGTSFNLGPIGFVGASVPLLAWLYLSIVRHRPGFREARDERELHRRRWEGVLCSLAGFVALFLAVVGAWERFTWNYVAPAASPDVAIDKLRGHEFEAVRLLGLTPDSPLDELEVQLQARHVLDNPDAALQRPVLGLAAALLLLGLGAWYLARPEARHAPRLIAVSLFLFLGPLAGVGVLTFALHGFQQSLTDVYASFESTQELEHLTGRLYAACLEEDWRVSAQHEARIVDRRSGTTLVDVRALVAAPSSPFERWHLSWSGPIRREPQVVFTLLSRTDESGATRTQAYARGGLAEPDQAGRWSGRIAALLKRADG